LAIVFAQGNESQTEAVAAFDVANDRIGPDAAFLDEKIELGGHALFQVGMRGLDKQAIDADVQDARDIVAAIAAPADPDVL